MDKIFKRLKQLEEIYSELVDGLDNIIAAIDQEGRFLYLSASIERKLGYSPSELMGKKVIDFIHPDDHSQFLGRAFDTKTDTLPVVEYRILAKSGDYRWYKSLSKMLTIDDNVCGRFGVLYDITEQKRTEEQLKLSELKYRNIFENLLDVYVETSIDGVVLEISPSIKDLIGYTREEMLGKITAIHYVNITDRKKHVTNLKNEGKSSNHNIELLHKDGSIIPVSVSAVLSRDNQGKEYIISMVRDESERKKTELLLRESEDQLRQAQKMESIGNLAGGIAHDFNNILSAIIGFSELIKEAVPKNTTVSSDIQEVLTAGLRAKDLVQQILTFSKRTEVQPQTVSLQSIIGEVIKLVRSTTPTSIEIVSNLPKDTCYLYADPTQIHQIFMNLCTNATHAIGEATGSLKISFDFPVALPNKLEFNKNNDSNGEFIKIDISDTGPGIDDEIITKIFEPYFTTKETGEGTGLGLSVVHGIVTSMNGKIDVRSTLGSGTTFTVYLPIQKENLQIDQGEHSKIESKGKNKRITVIDDEKPMLKLITRILEINDFEVKAFQNSEEAITYIENHQNLTDLVITDMNMPKLNGLVVSSKISDLNQKIPVIIMTGYSKSLSDESLQACGASNFIMKPIDTGRMIELINSLI